MKIIAFEVRDYELGFFENAKKEHNIEIQLEDHVLSIENVAKCKGFTAVTTLGMSKIDKNVLDELKVLGVKYINTRTIGYNHIDVAYAKEIGLRVCNVEYPPESVADFAMMLILLSLRKYKQTLYRQNVNDYSLVGLQGKTLKSLTVGVIGVGQIGQTLIKNLSGFGCKILAFNLFEVEEMKQYAEFVTLDELYANSDLISLHLPLTSETERMINKESLAKMKDGVMIINTARGELMNVHDLIEGIETEKIGTLASDVFEGEQEIYHENRVNDIIANRNMAYLRQFPNVVLTPHMAFFTETSTSEMVYCGINGLIEMSKGSWKKEL